MNFYQAKEDKRASTVLKVVLLSPPKPVVGTEMGTCMLALLTQTLIIALPDET